MQKEFIFCAKYDYWKCVIDWGGAWFQKLYVIKTRSLCVRAYSSCDCYVLVYEFFMSLSLNSKSFINSSSLLHNILPQGLRGSLIVVTKSVILQNVTSFSKTLYLFKSLGITNLKLIWNFWSGEKMWFKYEKLIKMWCFEPKPKYMFFPMC